MRRRARAGHGSRARAPGGNVRSAGVLLAWARDRDGAKVHAAGLDGASRRARGPFSCLACGERVVARLGPVRARHFAHLPGSTCALTAPESALHLDAKERLLALCRDAFAGARRVAVLARCPSCRQIDARDLAALGDAALEEGAVGALRADVLVLARGAPALALEVKVTHALEPEKEAALAACGVPAIELDAREAWERETPGAVELVPSRSVGFAPCASCAALSRADADRGRGGEEAEIAELEAYRKLLRADRAPGPSSGHVDDPLSPEERDSLARSFRCPDCGRATLELGKRLAKHLCPRAPARAVAWRGYDGALVTLSWWRPGRRRSAT